MTMNAPTPRGILRPGETCSTFEDAPACGLLVDGEDYYREFYEAAKTAKRFIAISGWQFDREVPLLRGQDAEAAGTDARFLAFLDGLCAKNPDLRVYILAWDYSVLYALEREWLQQAIFNWTTSDRLFFRTDVHPSAAGSHHQKMAIIDGALAFTGGMDICASRWDDRCHWLVNPNRDELGKPHGPYHDVQAYVTGAAAARLTELFAERWEQAGHGKLDVAPVAGAEPYRVRPSLALPASRVALSQTRCGSGSCKKVREIRALYAAAIDAAEHSIYIENQYFTSHAVADALERRMQAADRSRLEVVFVLPQKPEALKEELALGLEQTKLLRRLKETAAAHGHAVGVYCSIPGEETATYIHSKLLVVDDRFLSVGSANTTNRSMGLDSELNLSWEVAPGVTADPTGLADAIRAVRVSLLREHCGVPAGTKDAVDFLLTDGIVARLDALAADPACKLAPLSLASSLEENPLLKAISPDGFVFDAEDESGFLESISFDPTRIMKTLFPDTATAPTTTAAATTAPATTTTAATAGEPAAER